MQSVFFRLRFTTTLTLHQQPLWRRNFSSSSPCRIIKDVSVLPQRLIPKYQGVRQLCAALWNDKA